MSAPAEAAVTTTEEEVPNGKGSYSDPYKKRDGTKMVKLNLSVPIEFVRELKEYTGKHLELGESTSSFVVKVVRKEIKGRKR